MRPLQEKDILSNYEHALVHLAWHSKDNENRLVFCLIELLPKEFPVPDTESCKIRVGENDNSIFIKRCPAPALEAWKWYSSVEDGEFFFPPKYEGTKNLKLNIGILSDEPEWPKLVVLPSESASIAPFIPSVHNCPSIHAKICLDGFQNSFLSDIEFHKRERILQELSDNLFFDIKDKYSEFLGSIHLVIPNPIFREVHIRGDSSEKEVHVLIELRAFQNIKGLSITIRDNRYHGILDAHKCDLTENNITFPFDYIYDNISIEISHSEYGLLHWSEPFSFIHSINIGMKIPTGRRRVQIPRRVKHGKQEYEVSTGIEEQSIVGESKNNKNALSILYDSLFRREKKKEGSKYKQHFFLGQEGEAEEFLRNIIHNAERKILFVDPYFTMNELFRFSLSTFNPSISIEILTWSNTLKRIQDKNDITEGELLKKGIEKINEKLKTLKFDVRVMGRNETPFVHDRFLQIDDNLWLLGSSLNRFGNSGTTAVIIPFPEPILAKINEIWENSAPLEDWLKKKLNEIKRESCQCNLLKYIRNFLKMLKK